MTAEPLTRPRVKICCIKSPEEAALAIRCGASALGLVSSMPSGPGVIDEGAIARVAATVPPSIGTFLLTCATEPEAIVAQHRRCRTNTIQLCDYVAPAVHQQLTAALPGISIVQVVHVTGADAIAYAEQVAPHVHALLLDSGNPTLEVKELGGTGRVHDWQVSREICKRVGVPVFLAGGLKPANVQQAVESVRPFGLDLCSSVRTNDQLDEQKLVAFFSALNGLPH